jgi:light-regulated signal transduction histidine kinase (bacteriophytochrome)
MKDVSDIEILIKTFDELPIGVGIFHVEDLDDITSIRYVFMNKVVLSEMRKTKEEVFGKKIIEVAPEAYEHEGGRLVIETYRNVAKDGKTVNLGLVEYSNHLVAGTYECSIHPIKDKYIYVMLRNVTDLEKLKDDLELKNKELSQFAYLVSHDLKEPLRTMSSYIQYIKEEYQNQLDSNAEKLLGYISNAASRMAQLINDLLDFSKTDNEKVKTQVDCKKLIEIIQQDLSSKISETQTSIIVNDLPEITGYETELRLLFQNLISNAIKFTKPNVHPEVTISAVNNNGWIFSVKDNGIGIANEHREKIFKAFKRLHSKNEYEGTGIGLAHCKKIIDMHEGHIWVDSEIGKGSTFNFFIPDKE